MAIKVEVIVGGGVNVGELLQRASAPESLTGSLPSSERLMGIALPPGTI